MLLSVLMPVHNGERFLARAIASTLADLPPDSELVVLNDGSTDRTADILTRNSDHRLRVIQNEDRSGVASALNNLLNSTDSRYIARMDSDDVVLRGRFQRQIVALRQSDIVFTTAVWLDWRERPTGIQFPFTARGELAHMLLLAGNYLVHPTMAARRNCLVSLGGYPDTLAEDYALWLRAAAHGVRLTRLGVAGIGYRRHAGQLSSSAEWANLPSDPVLDDALQALLRKYRPDLVDDASLLRRSLSYGYSVTDPRLISSLTALPWEASGLNPCERLILRGAIARAIHRTPPRGSERRHG